MTPERNRPSEPPKDREPDTDVLLMSRISNEMVQAQKKYFGRGPTQAKSYMLDDFLLVVMRGGMTTAESTMLEFGRADLVRNFRQELENELAERVVTRMQELTGRTIVNHEAQIMFDPHIVVEMFFFESEGASGVDPTSAE
jgi:uncharacterized protein YbcI